VEEYMSQQNEGISRFNNEYRVESSMGLSEVEKVLDHYDVVDGSLAWREDGPVGPEGAEHNPDGCPVCNPK